MVEEMTEFQSLILEQNIDKIEKLYINKMFDINKEHKDLSLYFGEYTHKKIKAYGFKSILGYNRIFIECKDNIYGYFINLTCLQFSIFTANLDVVKFFISKGANPFTKVFN
jgi:hypothetical protein